MDLLYKAYSNTSDEEEDKNTSQSISYAKKSRLEEYSLCHVPYFPAVNHDRLFFSEHGKAPVVAGRYVSKRERALASTSLTLTDSPSLVIKRPDASSLYDADIPGDLKALLKGRDKAYAHEKKLAGKLSLTLKGHNKSINSIQWSHKYAHLLASAGMDQSVIVWNIWNKAQKKVCTFNHHNAAVTDVRWSPHGLFVLSCGYDCLSRLIDIEKGIETQQFNEDQIVQSIRFLSTNSNVFLSGGSKGILRLWDIRAKKVVHEYLRHLGPILDVEFSVDGKYFISSTDTSRSNISENSIIIWDVSREIPLSNQVYTEAFTCPCVRYHPSDACFVAQSNGNYIAIFSARPPFRLDRYKRYEGHGVWGYPIKCNFSLNGDEMASGSSDGSIYIYDYRSTQLLRIIKAHEEPCIDVAFHPSIPNLMASCSWNGEISVFN